MAYEPLHHKYRPQRFADLVGQAAVVQALSNAIRLGKIAPAYLFCGPRGTGKTSSARILAKSLNCIHGPTPDPCNQCPSCLAITSGSSLDVIEIDAASNTGVDNIRELIERAQFSPVQSKYKIYVLDEVHMLSTAAFNALLKTLEEPPSHVVFVLATTDPQRVLPTVISRCQRFDYRRIPLPDLVAHLAHIAQQEAITATPAALELIGQLAQGGLRDAESMLDQLSLLPAITPEAVWDLVGAVPERELLALMLAIASCDPQTLITHVRHLLDHGKEPLAVLQGLVGMYRDLLLAKAAPHQRELVAITQETWEGLIQLSNSLDTAQILHYQHGLLSAEPTLRQTTQPRLWLEISLLDLLAQPIQPSLSVVPPPPLANVMPAMVPAPTAATPAVQAGAAPVKTPATAAVPAPVNQAPTAEAPPPPPTTVINNLSSQWETFLQRLSPVAQALFRMGHVAEERPNTVVLGFPSAGFAQKAQGRLSTIQPVLTDLLGRSVTVEFATKVPAAPPATPATPSHAQPSHTAPSQTAPSRTESGAATSADHTTPPLAPTKAQPRPTSSPPASTPPPVISRHADESELSRSAQRLAAFFNGAVVRDDPDAVEDPALAEVVPEVADEDSLPF